MSPEFTYADTADTEYFTHDEIQIGKEHPRHVEITAATVASSPEKPNEDTFAVAVKDGALYLGLFDGTTSLKSIKSLGSQTGARFASHFLKDNFSAVAADTPAKIKFDLNKKLLDKSLAFEGASLEDTHTLPASTATIVKVDSDTGTLSLAHVGDSYTIAYYADGHSEVLTDDKNGVFDGRMFTLIEEIAKEKGITHREARQDDRVNEALIAMYYERNNNPNGKGSGLVNGDPHVQQYIQSHEIALDGVQDLLLGSDGLPPQGWSIANEEDRQRMRKEVKDGGFRKLFDLKHQSEDEDPDWKHVRYKHSDDATGMLISFKS